MAKLSRQQFIQTFKPQFRGRVTELYDAYQKQNPRATSAVKQTAKDVALRSIPWIAVPTVMAAILRRGMYDTADQRWTSAKVIGGTALASAVLRAAYDAPGVYKGKRQYIDNYDADAQQTIMQQLQKNATYKVANPVTTGKPQSVSTPAPAPTTVPAPAQAQVAQNPPAPSGQSPSTRQLLGIDQSWKTLPTAPQPQQPQQPQQTTTQAQDEQEQQPSAVSQVWDGIKNQAAGVMDQLGNIPGVSDWTTSLFTPGQRGDARRTITFGGLALLLSALSGQGLGTSILMGILGAGLGHIANKYIMPMSKQWSQASKFVSGIKDKNLRENTENLIGSTIQRYLFNSEYRDKYDAPGTAVKDELLKYYNNGSGGKAGYDPKKGFWTMSPTGIKLYLQDQEAVRKSEGSTPAQTPGTTQVTVGTPVTFDPSKFST